MDNSFIANLLVKLLYEYNRVSLPCLGSFIGQYKPSYFSSDGKTVYPPSKIIEFQQNEIWNDERLEKLIAEHENISLGRAKEKLAFWIDNVCVKLSMGETVNLPNFGELFVSYGNRVKFIQYDKNNLLSESFGLEPIVINNPTNTKNNSSPTNTTINTDYKINQQNKSKPKNKYTWAWILTLTFILSLAAILTLIHYRIIILPKTITNQHTWINSYLKEQKVKEQSLFPTIQEKNNSNYKQNQVIVSDSIVIDSTQRITLDTGIITVNDSLQKDTLKTVPDEFYYIIVNSTNTYNNAHLDAKEWAKKGYIVQILYTRDLIPYKISIGFYKTEMEANNMLEEFKKENNTLTADIKKYNNNQKI